MSDTVPPVASQRWSASDYAKNGRFVQESAAPIFAWLAPKEIKAAGADVLGVDPSEELLAAARMKGLTVQKADGHALGYVHEFDAVFSNLSLHWMRAPELVIAGVARALRPRGRFVGELGGHGNVAAIATAMRAVAQARGKDPSCVSHWFYPTAEEYGVRLAKHGFQVCEMALVPRQTTLKTGMEGWLPTFGRFFFDQFEEPARTEAMHETIELLRPSMCDAQGRWTADHVRLRFRAELHADD